jgi:hypothetical protein
LRELDEGVVENETKGLVDASLGEGRFLVRQATRRRPEPSDVPTRNKILSTQTNENLMRLANSILVGFRRPRNTDQCCRYCQRFLIDAIVAENLHLATEQSRRAAVSYRQNATALNFCS